MTTATAVLAYSYLATGTAAVRRSGHPFQSSFHIVKPCEMSVQSVGQAVHASVRSARDLECRGSND